MMLFTLAEDAQKKCMNAFHLNRHTESMYWFNEVRRFRACLYRQDGATAMRLGRLIDDMLHELKLRVWWLA
jgi:hypothetical protein